MSGVVITGSQWGNEGKGKITDYLSSKADVVVRYQGGNDAGHTIKFNDKKYALKVIPSGIFTGLDVVLGNGMAINPKALLDEMNYLKDEGISIEKMHISDRAHLILPYHIKIDEIIDKRRGKNNLDVIRRGISACYGDKYARIGIRMAEFIDEEIFYQHLQAVASIKAVDYPELEIDVDDIFNEYKEYAKLLVDYVEDTGHYLDECLQQGKKVIFEGAQGEMLDIDYGQYPYVTSSHPGASGVSEGSGIGPTHIKESLGVIKAYTTHDGNAIFVTEIKDDLAYRIREVGREYTTVMRRPRRIGWFDAVAMNQARRMSGLTGVCLMHLDVLSGLDTIKICTGYKLDGEIIHTIPPTLKQLKKVEPIYEELSGWKEDISTVTSFKELPKNAQKYINRISELIKCPVKIFSVGPDRKQTIELEEIF